MRSRVVCLYQQLCRLADNVPKNLIKCCICLHRERPSCLKHKRRQFFQWEFYYLLRSFQQIDEKRNHTCSFNFCVRLVQLCCTLTTDTAITAKVLRDSTDWIGIYGLIGVYGLLFIKVLIWSGIFINLCRSGRQFQPQRLLPNTI